MAKKKIKKIYLTLLLPVYNEEKSITLQYEEIIKSVVPLKFNYEIIFVDDGSIDRSFEILKNISKKNKNVKIIKFRRNFGQTAALSAGIENSSGEIIIIMDSDLQNDAEDIEKLINKIEEGYDVVSGWRKDRKDNFFSRNLISKIANKIVSKVSGVEIHDTGSSQAYRGDVLRQVKLYGEMHRFIPIHASWIGAKITEVPVKHHARKYGESNYGTIKRIFKVLLDLTTIKFLSSYSTKPIYVFGGMSFFLFFLSIFSGISLISMKLLLNQSMVRNPLLLLTVMLIILSVMILLLGVLAELLIRVYHEARNESVYKIKETINL